MIFNQSKIGWRETGLLTIALLSMTSAFDANAELTQQCNERIDRSTPTTRFAPIANGAAVQDLQTGLTWQRCPLGYTLDDAGTAGFLADDLCQPSAEPLFSWQEALQAAEDSNTAGGLGGLVDWRVPTIHQLASITERRCHHPSLNMTIFPYTGDFALLAEYWSSTPAEAGFSGAEAWVWGFDRGRPEDQRIDPNGFLGDPKYLRLVR